MNALQQAAVAEATRRLALTFTVVGVTSHFSATLWLAQRAFGWGNDVIMGSLLHPQKGFRTKMAEVRQVPPFLASKVSRTAKDAILKWEHCDDAAHSFAENLMKERLGAMTDEDAKAYRNFGQRFNRAVKWQAKEKANSKKVPGVKQLSVKEELTGMAAKYKSYEA